MQYSRLFFLMLICVAALGQSCDVLSTICSAVTCPAAVTLDVNGQSYAASDFNLISFGDVSINQGDVEGRVAVKGNFNAAVGGVSIGHTLASSSLTFSLIAGGNVNWVNGAVYPSNAGIFVGGNFSGANDLRMKVFGTCNGTSGCLDSAFSSISGYFSGVSSALASRADSATVSVQFQQATVTCSGGSSVYSVSVSSDTFNSVTSFASSGCDGATIIMNINGNGPVNFVGSPLQSSVVYNIPTATTVNVGTYVYGSIIAPNAVVSQGNGTIAGLVVAASISALVQVNMPVCPSSTSGAAPATTGAAPATTGEAAPATTGAAAPATTGEAAPATTGAAAPATTGAAAPATTGAAAATTGSTTGNNNGGFCTFLDAEAACPSVSANLGGSNYNFNFGDYDVVVFGDLNAASGDIEGRTFAYGNVNVNQFSFGLRAAANAAVYSLVGGSLNFPGGSINNGRAFIAGTVTASSGIKKLVSGPCTTSGCLDSIRSTGLSCYGDLSNSFANRSNVAVSVASNGRVTLTCNSASDSVYYFSSSETSMVNAAGFTTSGCNANAIFVLSLTGSQDVTFTGATAPAPNVIYNIVGSRTVTVQTAVNGYILAPQANVVMNSGVIVGKVVAASATVIQVNIPNACVSNSSTTAQSSSNANSGALDSAGINMTPSVLVMLIALFFAKLF